MTKTSDQATESKELSTAQKRQLQRHIELMTKADWEIERAQQARDKEELAANNFLVYCAEEHGVVLGADGWKFVQNEMRFVQMPVPPPSDNGQEGS